MKKDNEKRNFDMKKILKNKKIWIGIIFLLIIGLGIFLYLNKDYKEVVNELKITYIGKDTVNIEKIDKGFVYEKEITIVNNSSELKTYSLDWKEIDNKFKEQSKLLYEIKSTGERAATLERSQVPGVKSIIFPQVVIMPGKTQTYTIKIWYDGDVSKDKDSVFTGRLKVTSEKLEFEEQEKPKNEI